MRRKSESGAVLPLVAISLAVMMGFAGMTVDVGYLEYQQRQQQSAADAAAIGGAQQLLRSTCPNVGVARPAGQLDAAAAGYTDGTGGTTVNIQNPPPSGPYATSSCAVYAQITAPHRTTFASFFRPGGMQETTEATATIVNNNDGCIYVLDPTARFQLNGTSVNAPKCGINSNASVQVNGGTIDVGSFGYLGSLQSNGVTYKDAQPQKMIQVQDPCPLIASCAAMAASPPAQTSCSVYTENGVANADVKPGCYSSFVLNGGSVHLEPGTYTFTGTVMDNGPPVTGSDVTIYVSATGGPVLFNGSSVTLTPPAGGLLFYQDPSNKSTVQFNGSNMDLSGVMYAPGALGQINGSGGNYLVLVFGNVQLNGGFTVDPGKPVDGQSYLRNIVLAQ
ncbi:MAG TPA: pilus assembly protein TadG-related protein [Candidatus Cybelea sp.]|jgi:hypothetical protein